MIYLKLILWETETYKKVETEKCPKETRDLRIRLRLIKVFLMPIYTLYHNRGQNEKFIMKCYTKNEFFYYS